MKVHVSVPATTANLGPGFDALGLALDLWNETDLSLREDGKVQLTVRGEGQNVLPLGADNMVARAALRLFELTGEPCPGLQIDCLNRVPLGSGMGSSSAALLTGLLGANGLLGNPMSDEDLLYLAIEIEGHPDNVAPAMLGGLVVSMVKEGRAFSMRLSAEGDYAHLYVTIALPDFYFPTHEARAILPDVVSWEKAVFNISRAILVTEALRTGDLELLGRAMKDSLHQPYRMAQIPGSIDALEAAKAAGAAAVALSGAGPSLIAFASGAAPEIGAGMKQAFKAAGLSARIFELKVSPKGAGVMID
ncbi:MAG: homoserine kinase [Anaerolineales bacterium]